MQSRLEKQRNLFLNNRKIVDKRTGDVNVIIQEDKEKAEHADTEKYKGPVFVQRMIHDEQCDQPEASCYIYHLIMKPG
jgi:hypothetical protein